MCPSKLPQSCRKQKVMTAQYCGQPVRLAAPRPPLLFSLFSLVLFFLPRLFPPPLPLFSLKVSQCAQWPSTTPTGNKKKTGAWHQEGGENRINERTEEWQRRGEEEEEEEEGVKKIKKKKKENLKLKWGKRKISLLLEASRAQSWIWQERWVSIPFLTSLIKPLTLKKNPPHHTEEEDLSPLDVGHFKKENCICGSTKGTPN